MSPVPDRDKLANWNRWLNDEHTNGMLIEAAVWVAALNRPHTALWFWEPLAGEAMVRRQDRLIEREVLVVGKNRKPYYGKVWEGLGRIEQCLP